MSERGYIECDGCGVMLQTKPTTYGTLVPYQWIVITRSCSSGMKIGAGQTHFCSEKCLLDVLTKEKEQP